MRALTDRQGEVLRFITSHFAAHGWAPTVREIADAFGFASTNAATDHLEALQRKGAIRVGNGKARAIRVL